VPTDMELASIELTRDRLKNNHVYRAVGCSECNQKGYLGRTVIQELLMVTEEIRSLIMKREDAGSIKKAAIAAGMETMRDHGVSKVISGVTTIEEVISNTQLDEQG